MIFFQNYLILPCGNIFRSCGNHYTKGWGRILDPPFVLVFSLESLLHHKIKLYSNSFSYFWRLLHFILVKKMVSGTYIVKVGRLWGFPDGRNYFEDYGYPISTRNFQIRLKIDNSSLESKKALNWQFKNVMLKLYVKDF